MTLPAGIRALWDRALGWYRGYSERDRRIILGILVAAGLSLLYIGILEPLLDYRKAMGKEIADGQEELERSMRFVAAKDTLRAEREDLRKRLGQAKARLLPGATGTLGAAALQERANALASEKGISVQSTQVMKEEVSEPFHKVAVRLTLSGELKPLADFVSGIEYGQQLTIPFIEASRRGAVAGAKGPRTISATVEVSGFVQGGLPPKSDGGDADTAAVDGPVDVPNADGAATSTTLTESGALEGPTPTMAGTLPTTAPPPADGAVEPSVVPATTVPITFPPMVIPTPTVPATPPPAPQAPAPPPNAPIGGNAGDGEAPR